MATVTNVTKLILTAKEGFTTTTSGSVASGATTVGLNSVSGYSNGDQVALVIDPTDVTKKQAFTGTIDTAGVQVTGVVWTEGTNQTHTAGATVVDYTTATHQAVLNKMLRVSHADTGDISATNTATFASNIDVNDSSTAIRDSSDNELVKFAKTASAVNEVTVTNAATGNAPQLSATGGDTNIDIALTPKGTGRVVLNGAGAPNSATVATAETTTSTSYADLTTTTDTVTATIGASGLALIAISARVGNSNSGVNTFVGVDISGASTVAAADADAIFLISPNTVNTRASYVFIKTGLTAGSTTFKMKYKVSAGTGQFQDRKISVLPL